MVTVLLRLQKLQLPLLSRGGMVQEHRPGVWQLLGFGLGVGYHNKAPRLP